MLALGILLPRCSWKPGDGGVGGVMGNQMHSGAVEYGGVRTEHAQVLGPSAVKHSEARRG